MIDTFKRLHHAPLPEHPDKGFNMEGCYFEDRKDFSNHNCGTAACLMGWSEVLFGTPNTYNTLYKGPGDLTCPQPTNGCDYHYGFNPEKFTLPAAIRVLEILRDTGKVDWNEAIKNPWQPKEKPSTDWADVSSWEKLTGLPEGPMRKPTPAKRSEATKTHMNNRR